MTRPTVYVSYHDDDRAVVARLKKALEQSGLTVFDRQSRDMHWVAAIEGCRLFLACCSSQPVNEQELALALAPGRRQESRLLTVKLADCDDPERLAPFPSVRLDDFDEAVTYIVSHVGVVKSIQRLPKRRRRGSSLRIVVDGDLLAGEVTTESDDTRLRVKKSFVVDHKLGLTDGDQ